MCGDVCGGREDEEEVVVCVEGREGEGVVMMYVGERSPTVKY